MTLYTRAQWNALPPRSVSHAVTPTRGVYVHHVGEMACLRDDHQDCLDLVRQIQSWHLGNAQEGYADIAYSMVACHHGHHIEGRSTQADPRVRPGATGRENTRSYAILGLYGMRDGADVPQGLLDGLAAGIRFLRNRGGADDRIAGHRDAMQTACPGHLYPKLEQLRRLVDETPTAGDLYTVRPGDTLTGIARQWNTTVRQILEANPGIANPDRITVGQQLRRPGPTPPPAPTPAPAPRLYGKPPGTVWYRLLRPGATDSDSVRNLQRRLIDKGYPIPAGPTGNYAHQTTTAVAAFQRDQGWRGAGADGIPGPKTTERLFVYPGSPYTVQWGQP
jgi:hypothetical protein